MKLVDQKIHSIVDGVENAENETATPAMRFVCFTNESGEEMGLAKSSQIRRRPFRNG